MTQATITGNHLNTKLLGILRTKPGTSLKNTIQAVQTAFDVGIEAVEITSNSCHWYDVVYFCSRKNLNIGVGSIKDEITALEAINCGAKFFVSPGLFEEVLSVAKKYKIKIMPGVYKEPDLNKASEHGIRDVKFFPASVKTHEELFKAIKDPFRDEFEELGKKGYSINYFRDTDFIGLHEELKYIVESPTEFYNLYRSVGCLLKNDRVVVKLPSGSKGFDRLKNFSQYALKHGVRTYAVGGVNDKNMREVLTKYGAYGVCPGSGMFNSDAIFIGDFNKVRSDIERHQLILKELVAFACNI